MLKIKNIDKIVGLTGNHRRIVAAGDYRDSLRTTGKEMFVFKIESQKDGERYNKSHDIVLEKNVSQNGQYYMFNMGLELATGIYINKCDLKRATDVALSIKMVLMKTENFYNK